MLNSSIWVTMHISYAWLKTPENYIGDTILNVWSEEHLHENRVGIFIKEFPGSPQIHWVRIRVSLFVVLKYPFLFMCWSSFSLMKSSNANLSHHSTFFRSWHMHFERFLSPWLVPAGKGLFALVPSELIGEQYWEWLVKLPGRLEVQGGEPCGRKQGWQQK